MQNVCEYGNRILGISFNSGLTDVETMLPVASLACNQIVLGAFCGEGGVEKAPFRLNLSSRGAGSYLVRIYSKYGLAVPDPLNIFGDHSVIDLRDSTIDLRGKRNRALKLLSAPHDMRLFGALFNGCERPINMRARDLDLFAAQIQGVFARRLN